MGFVVLTYDALGQGERLAAGNIHHDAGFALLPLGETIAGWMVWDSMRAIDYLQTLEDVDGGRIGVTGNSGGGLNTLFTSALDSRVRAAVVVGFTFEFNNWLKYGGTHCTCTHLPAMFRSFEWFEVAGLIAPRAMLMLQGDRDGIFPISGARRSTHNTAAVYEALGASDQVGFRELAGQPHAYSRPYREQMYGWMAWRLLGQGNGEPIAEGPVQTLSENDLRLLCDRDGSTFARAPSVVDLARNNGMTTVAGFERGHSSGTSPSVRKWVRELTAPPEALPQFLAPDSDKPLPVQGGWLEKFSFSSEDGVYIPGWRWTTDAHAVPSKTIVMVDDRGKATTAQSGLIRPLLAAGFALVLLDLRGRGETLGHFGARWNTNFRLLANQVDLGEPLAGRRAYDLQRALDYLASRQRLNEVAVVGVGDDALPTRLRQLMWMFRQWAYCQVQKNEAGLRDFVNENMGGEANVDPLWRELLRLLEEEIAVVEKQFAAEVKAQEEKDAIDRDACLAPVGETWEMLARQEMAVDRSIDRKVKILLAMRKEHASLSRGGSRTARTGTPWRAPTQEASPPGDESNDREAQELSKLGGGRGWRRHAVQCLRFSAG
jgi:dienelactone hydrolase